MPELPEVETVCRGLQPHMEGERINTIVLNRPDLRFPFPKTMKSLLTDVQVERIHRRAKYILMSLDNKHTLLSHLGMSGQMLINATDTSKHDHVIFTLGTTTVTYRDPRRFGFMDIIPTVQLSQNKYLKHLGVEPLSQDLNPAYLSQSFHQRKSPVKSLLLNQSIVAGVGNIYACEALFESGIHPECLGNAVNETQVASLCQTIPSVLQRAIASGGSSLRDHLQVDGKMGYFQHNFKVYGKESEPCQTCGTLIERIVQSGRSTFFCPQCQSF